MAVNRVLSWLNRFNRAASKPQKEAVTQPPVGSHREQALKWFQTGSEQLGLGLLEDAEWSYRSALRADAGYGPAWRSLGYLLWVLAQPEEALHCVERAIAIDPDDLQAHLVHADLAIDQKELGDALARAQRSASLGPSGRLQLHKVLALQGQYQAIEDDLQSIVQHGVPIWKRHLENADTFETLWWDQWGDRINLASRALAQYRLALQDNPRGLEVLVKQVQFLGFLGEKDDANSSLKLSLSIVPRSAKDYYWQGLAHRSLGSFDAARKSHEQAIAMDKRYAPPLKAIGNICTALGDLPQAQYYFHQAIVLDPAFVAAHFDLAQAQMRLGQPQQAIDSACVAVRLRPRSAELLFGLGYIFDEQKKLYSAIGCYRQALAIRPAYQEAKANLGGALLHLGDNQAGLDTYLSVLQDKPDDLDVHTNVVYCTSHDTQSSAADYLARACQYGALATKKATPYTQWPRRGVASGCLRVGLVSADFSMHPVGYFLDGFMGHVDPAQLEFHAFTNSLERDDLTVRLQSRCASWTSIFGLDDAQAADLVYKAGLDLLLDLSGHTRGHRLSMLAWRAAPVQATWLGYWASTGVAEMDYILVDQHGVPAGDKEHYCERVWYMPDTRMCFTAPSAIGELVPGELLAISKGYCTFGCYQPLFKINDAVLKLWATVLMGVPTAKLRLQSQGLGDLRLRAKFLSQLERAGIAEERVSLHDVMPLQDYMKSHDQVDIILDTFPFPGGTTTCTALWMGVPTVTLGGDTMLSRQGVGLLASAGLSDWVAQTPQDYVAIATRYAQDIPSLQRLRKGLREQVFASPLMDAPRFARNFERQLRTMVWGESAIGTAEQPTLEYCEDAINRLVHYVTSSTSIHATQRLDEVQRLDAELKRINFTQLPSLSVLHIVKIYVTLGDMYRQLGAHEKAESSYRWAISHDATQPEAYIGLGSAQADMGRYEDAQASFKCAIALNANSWLGYLGLGIVATLQKRMHQAVVFYKTSLSFNDSLHEAQISLGAAYIALGDHGAALQVFGDVLKQNPTNKMALSNIVYCSSFDPACPPKLYLEHAKTYGTAVSQTATPYARKRRMRSRNERLRVGLVSADFHGHPVGFFLAGFMGQVDTEKLEFHAFSNGTEVDDLTRRLQRSCASWTSILGLDDSHAAQLIHAKQLDVLLDCSGHTSGNRLSLFAWRPAPVQATWLGYWGSTGVAEIDYILADPHCVPFENDNNYTERVWRLPDTRMCFTAPSVLYETLPSPLPARQRGVCTFGSYQPLMKLSSAVLQIWARVMKQLPESRLRLQCWGFTEPDTKADILRRLATAGIDEARVAIYGGLPPQQYLRSHDEVDIILDTFPYTGGTTTCNALWMGVPTVTLAGNSMLSRQGVGLLMCAGLSDWVASTEDDYFAIAVAQASDLERLAQLRANLRQQVFDSPLMDAPLFAKNFEVAVHAMERDVWARLDQPETLEV